MTREPVCVRPIDEADRPSVAALLNRLWGAETSVAHGTVFRPAELPGLVAVDAVGQIGGLLTYQVLGGVVEIVTINAVQRSSGIGTALVDAAVEVAKRHGCSRLVLTTTNDNLDALRFYQRRGFRLVALRPGALAGSRLLKPEIPIVGDYGIPLDDELDLERRW